MRGKIFIVEDHPILRNVYPQYVEAAGELVVCGNVSSAEEALEKIPDAAPDVVMIDISLPGMSGIDLVSKLRESDQSIRLIVISGHDDGQYRTAALSAGADRFVTKGSAAQLLKIIRELLDEPKPEA